MVFALWPAAALADGETVSDGSYYYTVINGGTALRLDAYVATPTGIITLPDTVYVGYTYNRDMPVTEIAGAAFRNCADITSVALPSGLVSIGDNAFQNCGLYSITFPGTLRTIGYYAFDGCTHLQSPDLFPETALPNSLQSIGGCAFQGCSSPLFKSITIPDSVSGIGDSAFEGCTHLASAVLPANAGFTAVPDRLFYDCHDLTSVTIPDNVTSIGSYSFEDTGFSSFEVPQNVTSIDYTAFAACYNLASFTVEAGSTDFMADSGVLYSADHKKLLMLPFRRPNPLNVPEGVTEIGAHACNNCIYLTEVTLPSTLTTIGDYAFENTKITSVTIPANVTSIGDWAFQNCSQLSKAVFYTDTATFTGDWVFPSGKTFYGHAGSTAQTYASGHNISFVLLLELSSSPESGEIYNGGRITITPNVAGGTWDFDGTLLSRDGDVFTGLKAGTAHVTYTAGWQTESVDVVIRQAELPSTGQDFTAVYCMLAVAVVSGVAALYVLFRRKRAEQKGLQ